MKKILPFVAIVFLVLSSAQPQQYYVASPLADAHVEAFGGGQGKNTFFKFDVSLPPNCVIIEATIHVTVFEIGSMWDGDMMYIHYTNQLWWESDSTQQVWNDVFWGDTIYQNLPLFGDTIGPAQSVNLAPFVEKEYMDGNQYFSVRMKDPDDPTMFPQLNIPISNLMDSLMVGNIFNDHIIFRPRETGMPFDRPYLEVVYAFIPVIDAVNGAGTLCENEPLSLSASVIGDGPFSFQWQKDNVDIPSGTDSIFTIGTLQTTDAGFYRLIVNSPWAADTSDAVQLIVNTCANISHSIDLLTPDVFPNPGNDIFYISGIEEQVTVQIFSLHGVLVYEKIHQTGNNLLDLSHFDQGNYLVRITGNKVIIEKNLLIVR